MDLADAATKKAVDDKCSELRLVLAELGYKDDEAMLKTETFRHFLCVKMSICERMRLESRLCSVRGSSPTPELPLQETPPASDCSEGGDAVVDGLRATASAGDEEAAIMVAANASVTSSILCTTDVCVDATAGNIGNSADDRRSGIGVTCGAAGGINESHVTGRRLNNAEHVSCDNKDLIRSAIPGAEKEQIAYAPVDAQKERSIESVNVKSVITQERCRKRKRSRRTSRRAKKTVTTSSRSDSSEPPSRTNSSHRHSRRGTGHHNRRRRRHRSRHHRHHNSRSRSRSRRRSPSPHSRIARCTSSRSPSIRRRTGSPTHWDRRRITSARKRPVPYVRAPTPPSSTDSSPVRYGRTGRLRRSPSLIRRTRSNS